MKKKPSTLKDILFLSISSFVVVAAWIGFNIYHSWVTTTITPELQIQIIPIQPDFDIATVEKIKARKHIVPITTLSSKAPVPTPAGNETQPVLTPTPRALLEENIPVTVDGE